MYQLLHWLKPGRSLPTWQHRVALSGPVIALGRIASSVDALVTSRRRRPWLAMVAAPLAMSATMLMSMWWSWPLLTLCVWWWADSGSHRTWIVGVEAALFGAMWTYAGAVALADFPDSRTVIATTWITCALAMAAVSAYNHRHNWLTPRHPSPSRSAPSAPASTHAAPDKRHQARRTPVASKRLR